MTSPTLSTMPEDILDEIYGFVGRDRFPSLSPSRASSVLSHLSRTYSRSARRIQGLCRTRSDEQTPPPYRHRHLYSHPLLPSVWTWERALKVLDTLTKDGGGLGRLVRSLVSLTVKVETLSTDKTVPANLSFQVRGQTKVFSWCLAMLDACARLREVGVTFAATIQLNKVSHALTPSFLTLERIKVEGPKEYRVSAHDVIKLLKCLSLSSLKTLEVNHLRTKEGEPPLPLTPSNPTPTSSLIFRSEVKLSLVTSLIPINTSSLTSLTISCKRYSSSDLLTLVNFVGSTLETLKVVLPFLGFTLHFDDYGLDHQGPIVPLEVFFLLPRIRYLDLWNAHAMSMARLDALVKHSPDLVELGLSESVWVGDGALAEDRSGNWSVRMFPEDRVLSALLKLKKLERCHLGFVPRRQDDYPSSLAGELEDEGVALVCEIGGNFCHACGGWH